VLILFCDNLRRSLGLAGGVVGLGFWIACAIKELSSFAAGGFVDALDFNFGVRILGPFDSFGLDIESWLIC